MTAGQNNRGFTLIELLIVISIIGVLAAMGMVGFPAVKNIAKKRKAETTVQGLEIALSLYKNDYGIYPDDDTSESVMNALTGYKSSPDSPDDIYRSDPDWNGPYFHGDSKQFEFGQRNRALLDPWQSKYQFNLSDPKYNHFTCDIWSAGPNRKDEKGKGDDINNW